MSFVFPKPVLTESRNSSYQSDLNRDDTHSKLIWNPEPDYDELLIRLSLYAFNLLTPSDQRKQVARISRRVNVEDVQFLEESDEACILGTFTELFKKLPFSDQLKLFLSKVIEKFKRERQFLELISSFKQLGAEHQQQLIDKIVHGTPENLRNPGETEEELRLRRFTQLSRDYTLHVYKSFFAWKVTERRGEQEETSSDNQNGSKGKSCFAEFFSGFSVIWFQGQSASGQDMLIQQLDNGIRGVAIEKRMLEESEEDFKLRRFTKLCQNVVDIRVQEKFLEIAKLKLQLWAISCNRLIGEPQDSDTAAELLSHLWTFGVSLLSAKYQQRKIDEMSQVESDVKTERPSAAVAEEAVRIRRLTELFSQVPVRTRIDLFEELRKTLLAAKRYSEAVRVFRGLDSEYQTEIIEYMFYRLSESWKVRGVDPCEVIDEKFWGESEEDFRFRRFINMCIKHLSIWEDIFWPGPHDLQLHCASDPYDEFLLGVAIIWFKAKCAGIRRNPIQLILSGKVEIGFITERLPEESVEDFRLRRFRESFKQLDFTYQECVLYYIQNTMSSDLGNPKPEVVPLSWDGPSEGRGSFDPEWINYKPTNPRDQVAATTQGQGATTHAAAVAQQGTTQHSLVQK